jgi:hypothetical protein
MSSRDALGIFSALENDWHQNIPSGRAGKIASCMRGRMRGGERCERGSEEDKTN